MFKLHTIPATLCDNDPLSQPCCNQINLVAYVQCGKWGMWTPLHDRIGVVKCTLTVSVLLTLVKCAAYRYTTSPWCS